MLAGLVENQQNGEIVEPETTFKQQQKYTTKHKISMKNSKMYADCPNNLPITF